MCEKIKDEDIKDVVKLILSIESENEKILEVEFRGSQVLFKIELKKHGASSSFRVLSLEGEDLTFGLTEAQRWYAFLMGGDRFVLKSVNGQYMIYINGKFIKTNSAITKWNYADDDTISVTTEEGKFLFDEHGDCIKEDMSLEQELAECKRIIAENGYKEKDDV